jgi:hypothetical protein
MAAIPASAAARVGVRNRSYRVVRQLHLWIGAWGALAAILYGFSGLVLNHRFGDGAWPQGHSEETGRGKIAVPAAARATPEALSLWLRANRGLDAQVIRKGPAGGAGGGKREGGGPPPKWSLSGGTATDAWTVEYSPGDAEAEFKSTHHSTLSAVNRLHKGVGGGWAWLLLADSFAIGMLLLGLSGIWMWLRGREPKDMLLSVFALSVTVLAVVLGPALLA